MPEVIVTAAVCGCIVFGLLAMMVVSFTLNELSKYFQHCREMAMLRERARWRNEPTDTEPDDHIQASN